MEWISEIVWFCNTFFGKLIEAIVVVFQWLWGWLFSFIEPHWTYLINMVVDWLAYLSFPDLSVLADYWAGANLWLPLNELLQLMGVYWTVYGVFLLVRTILKLVPWIW